MMSSNEDRNEDPPSIRHKVYDSMYTQDDALRIIAEIMLIRRIEKERRVTEQLQLKMNNNSTTRDEIPQEAG